MRRQMRDRHSIAASPVIRHEAMLGLQKDAADRMEDGGKYDEGIEAGVYFADFTRRIRHS